MEYRVEIVLFPDVHPSKNGTFFERLMNIVFETHGYKGLSSNVNFTGLEIDLYGKHKTKRESVLVECKAKKKAKSTEVKNFLCNVFVLDKADHGYFVYTQELDHQAEGLRLDLEKNKDKSKRVTFLGPKAVIESLIDAKKIVPLNEGVIDEKRNIDEIILAYTYYGIFYVVTTYSGTEDKQFHVFDAENHDSIDGIHSHTYEGDSRVTIDQLALDIDRLDEQAFKEIYNRSSSLFNIDRSYIEISSEFKKSLDITNTAFSNFESDEGIRFEDLFVQPNLRSIELDLSTKSKGSNSVQSLDGVLDSVQRIAIFGESVSGKSSIAKYAFIDYFIKDFIPIFVSGRDFVGNIRKDKLLSIMGSKYDNQYDTNIPFEKHSNSEIVIVLDDFQTAVAGQSKYWSLFLENISEISSRILITGDYLTSYKVGIKTSNRQKVLFEDFEKFRILQHGPKSRVELIQKWYELKGSKFEDSNERLKQIDEYSSHIKKLIGNNYVPSFPFYILSALQAFQLGGVNQSNYSVYGFYYEMLIKNALNSALNDKRDYNLYNNYLSHFAFYLFEQNIKKLSIADYKLFHNKFCEKVGYQFAHVDAIEILTNSKMFKVDGGICFKEKYAYYYFIANYLSKSLQRSSAVASDIDRNKAKDIISSLIERVYRDEFSNIIMFLTHLSKDEFILDTLVSNAKLIFGTFDPCQLDKDVININELIDEIPQQVIKKIDVEESRKKDLEVQDEIENTIRSQDDTEDDLEIAPASIYEDVSAIDYFGKIVLALKTLDLLGQLAKAYWGELDSNDKKILVIETYDLGLRTLSSYFSAINSSVDGIAEDVYNVMNESSHGRRTVSLSEVKQGTKSFMFRLCTLISSGITHRISTAVGTDKLQQTFKKVLGENDSVAYKLIDLSIKLNHDTKIPIKTVEGYCKDFKKNKLAMIILRNMILNHMHLFKTSLPEKNKIYTLFNIKVDKQRIMEIKSKERKK